MEQRISLITLGVTDLARACAFYEALGWRRSVTAAKGVAFFQTGGMAMALYPSTDLAGDAGLPPPTKGFRGVSIAINTRLKSDVDAVLAEARSAGATMVRDGKDAIWGGYVGYFTDPDDHLWEVAWNPGFELKDDGSIVLPA